MLGANSRRQVHATALANKFAPSIRDKRTAPTGRPTGEAFFLLILPIQ
jgi:hypothetical protein